MIFKKYIGKNIQNGFTLIELMVVIAILGVLAVGLLAAINPIDKINSANDARAQNDLAVIARAAEAYTTTHDGFYPASTTDLAPAGGGGELKNNPTPPNGYAYTWTSVPAGCTTGTTCTGFTLYVILKSSRWAGKTKDLYDSTTGKQCQVATTITSCP